MLSPEERLIAAFPKLRTTHLAITSSRTANYNCIAWAAGDDTRWWEPDAFGLWYWPPGVLRQYTLNAYKRAYQNLGYKRCADGQLESGFEKIAIFTLNGRPTHAAKQLPSGLWTSKCGQDEDISHDLLGVSGPGNAYSIGYGDPAVFMRRPSL